MASTKSFAGLVRRRVAKDPEFATALLREGVEVDNIPMMPMDHLNEAGTGLAGNGFGPYRARCWTSSKSPGNRPMPSGPTTKAAPRRCPRRRASAPAWQRAGRQGFPCRKGDHGARHCNEFSVIRNALRLRTAKL